MAFELVSWVHFRSVLHHFSSRARLEGSWAQVWPEHDRQPTKTVISFCFPIKTASKTQCRSGRLDGSLIDRPHDLDRWSALPLVGPAASAPAKAILSGSLAILHSDFWAGFRPISGQTWPPNPSRTTGLVLQCLLLQTSAPQTNSKANSWQF